MKSERRTAVAVLRASLEMNVEEFGELIGKSIPTIRSLESGKLKLSERLAAEIAIQTGVDPRWLLAGDPKTPIRDIAGGQWRRGIYEQLRVRRTLDRHQEGAEAFLESSMKRLRNLIETNRRLDPAEFLKFLVSLEWHIERLEKEFSPKTSTDPPSASSARREGGRKSA